MVDFIEAHLYVSCITVTFVVDFSANLLQQSNHCCWNIETQQFYGIIQQTPGNLRVITSDWRQQMLINTTDNKEL